MPLPTKEDLAKSFLDSLEKHFEAQADRITCDIDNLLANPAGIDDHQRIDNALAELFDKVAIERDKLDAVRQYRGQRKL